MEHPSVVRGTGKTSIWRRRLSASDERQTERAVISRGDDQTGVPHTPRDPPFSLVVCIKRVLNRLSWNHIGTSKFSPQVVS